MATAIHEFVKRQAGEGIPATGVAISPAKLTEADVQQLVLALGQGHGAWPSVAAALEWITYVEFIRWQMAQIQGVLSGQLLVRFGDDGPEYGLWRVM